MPELFFYSKVFPFSKWTFILSFQSYKLRDLLLIVSQKLKTGSRRLWRLFNERLITFLTNFSRLILYIYIYIYIEFSRVLLENRLKLLSILFKMLAFVANLFYYVIYGVIVIFIYLLSGKKSSEKLRKTYFVNFFTSEWLSDWCKECMHEHRVEWLKGFTEQRPNNPNEKLVIIPYFFFIES